MQIYRASEKKKSFCFMLKRENAKTTIGDLESWNAPPNHSTNNNNNNNVLLGNIAISFIRSFPLSLSLSLCAKKMRNILALFVWNVCCCCCIFRHVQYDGLLFNAIASHRNRRIYKHFSKPSPPIICPLLLLSLCLLIRPCRAQINS